MKATLNESKVRSCPPVIARGTTNEKNAENTRESYAVYNMVVYTTIFCLRNSSASFRRRILLLRP